jgi:hypothetical protein
MREETPVVPQLISRYQEKTLPLSVANTAFLIDRMGEDCHPLQFLRELNENSIESILRTPEKRGKIVWDVDWKYYDDHRIYKLSVTDTGDGMTGEEMARYINKLSSSISEQSFGGNYGVGAKIAAATRNHAGVIYFSWKNAVGTMIHFWRDPHSGIYGLRQFEQNDGYHHYAEIEDDIKPEEIKDHGTKVVLFGAVDEADTMTAPPGSSAPSRWISKYLNTRYFRFPKGITIQAREGWTQPIEDKDRNLLRTVIGQEKYLTDHAEASGTRQLKGAVAHWWILKDERAITQNSGFVESAGHVAALYDDELYELQTARSGMARLQQFGVILGYRRVVIYVEPARDGDRRITTNTARTILLLDSEPLPWAEWAAEFREKMPKAIVELVSGFHTDSAAEDQTKSIRDRLKQVFDLFKVSRYRPSATGTLTIDMDAINRGSTSRSTDYKPITPGGGGHGGGGGTKTTAGGAYSAYLKKDGAPGDEITRNDLPEPRVNWVTTKDGTRTPPDLDDRAAKFLLDQNHLIINADFRVFTDMIERFKKELGGSAAVNDIITHAVRTWFQQTLMETVIGIQALQKSKEWTTDDIAKAISEEALTTAVMPRYHVYNSVKRELGSKLGKMQVG